MLENRVALVTGGSKGIGRAICLELAGLGAAVAFNYHASAASAQEIKDEIEASGGKALALQADVCREQDIVRLVAETVGSFGKLDILVNCAGIMPSDPIETMTVQAWNRVMDTNLTSCFLAIREAVPHLRKSPCPRIISIASQAASAGSCERAHYCASKAGMLGMTYALAKELGAAGITVNAVSPGRVETDILAYGTEEKRREWLTNTPLNRLGTVNEIAGVVSFLASDKASYITGANINVSGGLLMG